MPSPSSPAGPNLPLSCSSASSEEEEEDREEGYDDEDEDDYEDEVTDPVGESVHHNAATEALVRNPSASHSLFLSGDEDQKNGTAAGGSKRSISDDTVQDAEGKRPRPFSAAVTPATPLSVALSLPAQGHPGDATEMHGKAIVSVGDDSRRLFQRLWTDEDEIGLLKGFYDYSRRGYGSFHEKAPFYDQVKASLQFDYNKNQLVEKLRRLKKKYRNVVKKLDIGKDFAFKNAHDQLTFEISRKIWGAGFPTAGDDDDEDPMAEQKPVRVSRKSRAHASKRTPPPSMTDGEGNRVGAGATASVGRGTENADLRSNRVISPVSSMVEETVRSCLLPIIKELMCCGTANGSSHTGFRLGMNPLPLRFGGAGEFKRVGSEEKWRKQQIVELEVYLKRIELVQEQIKLTLQELKSMDT